MVSTRASARSSQGSAKPKAASQAIEPPSGSEASYGDVEDAVTSTAAPVSKGVKAVSKPPAGKRKSKDEDEIEEGLELGLSQSPANKRQKLPVRSKGLEVAESGSSQPSTKSHSTPKKVVRAAKPVGSSQEKSGHIRFDDDKEPQQFYTPLEAPARNPLDNSISKPRTVVEDSEEDDSDDDAPPEAVSTSKPASSTLKTLQNAAKAAEIQATEAKRKRQERDALYKKQAEERKRAAAQETAKPTAAEQVSKAAAATKSASVEGFQDADMEDATNDDALPRIPSGRRRSTKRKVPDLLPEELLASDDEVGDYEDSLAAAAAAAARPNKKIKFSEAEQRLGRDAADRTVPDRRVGDTVYRVTKRRAEDKMAPKMRKTSRNEKLSLLARQRAPQRKGGFFVKNR